MAFREPHITINGHPLTDAQAMAVRVAVTMYDSEVLDERETLGPIADAYHARLTEVLTIMLR